MKAWLFSRASSLSPSLDSDLFYYCWKFFLVSQSLTTIYCWVSQPVTCFLQISKCFKRKNNINVWLTSLSSSSSGSFVSQIPVASIALLFSTLHFVLLLLLSSMEEFIYFVIAKGGSMHLTFCNPNTLSKSIPSL